MTVAGIKETKEVLELGFAIAKVVKLSLDDGKIGAEDLGHLLTLVPHLGAAFNGVGEVPAELKDLDSDEAKELLQFAAEKLGVAIDNPKLVEQINAGLEVGLAVLKLVRAL